MLDNIQNTFALKNSPLQQHHQKYVSFYSLIQQYDNDDHPGLTELPKEVLVQFETYIDSEHPTAGKALSILLLNNAIDYQERFFYPEEEMVTKSGQAVVVEPDFDIREDVSNLAFSVYPNPGREYITLAWCLENSEAGNLSIEILQNDGTKIQTIAINDLCNEMILSAVNLVAGNYIAILKAGNAPQKSISFVIVK